MMRRKPKKIFTLIWHLWGEQQSRTSCVEATTITWAKHNLVAEVRQEHGRTPIFDDEHQERQATA